jgi:ABC-type multidrug transport system ATPase subunit
LVTLPSVLILDEPTSGLDAFTSYLLLLTLSQLSRRGRTVILSIHAPRSDAFEVFDRIALLTKGEIVYSGRRKDCLGWFHSLGHDVEQGVNPLGESTSQLEQSLHQHVKQSFTALAEAP